VLEWSGPVRSAAQSIDPKSLKGIVADDASAAREGFTEESQHIGPYIGAGYRHDGDAEKGRQSIRFRLQVPKAGRYQVRVAYSPNANRATNVPVTIHHAEGETTVRVNQRQKPADGAFAAVGEFPFAAGETTIEISNADTDGHVIADAVQLLAAEAK
jgi:hypothetical protein